MITFILKNILSNFKKLRSKAIFPFVVFIIITLSENELKAQYNISGDATSASGSCYELTDGNSQSGAVWNTSKIDLNEPFDITLTLNFGNNDGGADGMSFVLQPISSGVFSDGSGVGYAGVTPSIGVVMDDYQNTEVGDPSNDHISLHKNGDVEHGTSNELISVAGTTGFPANIEDGNNHTFRFKWTPGSPNGTIQVWFDGVLILTYTGDIINTVFGGNPLVYWGVSGSTGGYSNIQTVCLNIVADFIATQACVGQSMSFTDLSISGLAITSYKWDFGDGTILGPGIGASFKNPTHVYTLPGTYTVNQTIVNSGGLTSTITSTVTVSGPTVAITTPPTSICEGSSITLNGTITPNPPTINQAFPFSNLTDYPINDGGVSSSWDGAAGAFVTSSIVASGINPGWGISSICLNINHTWDSDLIVYLKSPCGTLIKLIKSNGGGGDNYTNTCFASSSTSDISSGSAPFSGTYVPYDGASVWATLAACATPNGTWSLLVGDSYTGDTGTLLDWTITFSNPTPVTYTYNWTPINVNNTLSPVVTPTATTTYILVGTDMNGCTASSSVIITVNPSPIAEAGNNQTICSGTSASLTATGGGTYLWNTGSTNANISVTPATQTTYTVTVTSNGCTASDNVVVYVNTMPIAEAGSNQSICSGSSASLTATGGGTYQWDIGSSNAIISVSPTTQTTYTVAVTNNGCTASDNVVVFVNTMPIAEAGNNQTICSGTSASLTATGGGTYLWNTGSTNANISVTPTTQTTYTVTVTSNGCTASDNVVIFVNALPIAEAGSNQSICSGTSASLTATGGGTYQWDTGSSNVNISVSPSTQTTYTVTVTNNGCSASDNVVVFVNALPIAEAGSNQSICSGSSASLTATGGGTYLWSTGSTNANISVTPDTQTTYTVTVTNNTCTASDNVVVSINNNITPTITALPSHLCAGQSTLLTANGGTIFNWNTGENTADITVAPSINTTYTVTVSTTTGCSGTTDVAISVQAQLTIITNPAVICSGESTTLTASGGIDYKWDNGSLTQSITVSPTTTTTYAITVTDHACSATSSAVVTVKSLPIAEAGSSQTICAGNSANLSASGGGTYLWSTTETNSTINVSPSVPSTTYNLTVTNNGCSASDNVIVNVTPLPIADAGLPKTICIGDNIALTATGGASYLWNTGSANSTINVTPTVTSTYVVTVTSNACTASDNVVVTVASNPIADAGAPQAICEGSSINLIATGGADFKWSNGVLVANNNVSPTNTTTYTVTVSNGTCSSTDDVVVTVNTLPIAEAGLNQTICNGSSASLTASGGGTYQWNTGEAVANITVSPIITSTYTVTVTSNACTASDNVVVTVNPLPIATIATPVAICSGNNTDITASGGGTYLWNTGQITATINVAPTTTNTYTVTVSKDGCTSSTNVVVTVNPLPIASATANPTIICKGTTTFLNSNGGNAYSWVSSPIGFTSTSQNPSVTPDVTTTYTVLVTDANLCSDTESIIITVNQNPIATVSASPMVICEGSSSTLNSGGGTTFSWTSNPIGFTSTLQSPVVSPITTTTYSVVVSNAVGCSDTEQVEVKVNSYPIASASVAQSTICKGSSTTLNASGGTVYSWTSTPSGFTSSSSSPTISPTITTTYTVTVNNGTLCESTAQTIVNVDYKPQLTLQPSNIIDICSGADTTLSVSGGNSYIWSTGETTSSISISPTTNITYTLTATSGVCFNDTLFIVNVLVLSQVEIGNNITVCNGEQVTFSALSNTNQLVWSNGSTSSSISVSDSGIYSIIASNLCGIAYDTVKLLNHPTPTLNLGSDTTLCINNFQIVAPANFDKYYWSTGEIASSIVANTGGVYYVEAIDVNGCKASDSIKLTDSCYTDMFIPNAFTPNNDNFNEIFKAIGTNIVEFEIFIFNRWGEQLYHSEDILEGWNGTFKGRTCPQGVYYYLITYRGLRDVKKSAKGHLTLVR